MGAPRLNHNKAFHSCQNAFIAFELPAGKEPTTPALGFVLPVASNAQNAS